MLQKPQYYILEYAKWSFCICCLEHKLVGTLKNNLEGFCGSGNQDSKFQLASEPKRIRSGAALRLKLDSTQHCILIPTFRCVFLLKGKESKSNALMLHIETDLNYYCINSQPNCTILWLKFVEFPKHMCVSCRKGALFPNPPQSPALSEDVFNVQSDNNS